MNYYIKFNNLEEYKRALIKLQSLTGYPFSNETRRRFEDGNIENKHYCVTVNYEILTVAEPLLCARELKLDKIIKYNKS